MDGRPAPSFGRMLRTRTRFGFVSLAITLLHCTSSTVAFKPEATVPLGSPCRGYDECLPVPGKIVDCRCTDGKATPICTAEAEPGESCDITGNFQPVCRPGTR